MNFLPFIYFSRLEKGKFFEDKVKLIVLSFF